MRTRSLYSYRYVFLVFLVVAIAVYLVASYDPLPSEFPATVVINLDERTDRQKEIEEEFREWPVPVERVSAVKLRPGWKGCSASHLKCIRLAKERGYPWILILEDDCVLRPDASQRLQALLPFLWKNRSRWDIFYGGTTYLSHHRRISRTPSVHEVSGYATQFCLVHSHSYNRIVGGYPTDPSDYTKQIDVYYAETLRIWTTTPYLAVQRVGKSDVGKREIEDYTQLFQDAEDELMRS